MTRLSQRVWIICSLLLFDLLIGQIYIFRWELFY